MDNDVIVGFGVSALAIICGVLYAIFDRRVMGRRPSGALQPATGTSSWRCDIEDIHRAHRLANRPVRAILIRQSGLVHRDLGLFPTPEEAVRQVAIALRRAKIETLVIITNTPSSFSVRRLIFNHRGSSEGKRVGGAEITAL